MNLIEQIKVLKWGTLKADYRKIFSDKSWYPDHPTQNAVGFSDNYLGCPFQIYAYFVIDGDKDRLSRVILGCSNLTDEQYKDIFRKLSENLEEISGKPQFSQQLTNYENDPPEFRGSEMKTWKTRESVISATLALLESGSTNPGIGIIFGDIKNDPDARRWAKSELSDGKEPEKLPENFKFSDAQIEEIKRSMEKE